MLLRERFRRLKPLEDLEVDLVRASLAHPGALPPPAEAALRWSIGLARLHTLQADGGDLPVEEEIASFRYDVERLLAPLFEGRTPDLAGAAALAPQLAERSRSCRESLLRRHEGRLDPEVLDREVRQKQLVLALGGGGGVSYVYLGAFALLEEWGITPRLIAATSMGAILGLFRARTLHYDPGEIFGVVRSLSWSKLFRVLATESRYGLPAALRLYLRGPLGRWASHDDGSPWTFRDLPIPMLVTLSGIRRGMLPRPLSYYEQLLDPRTLALRPWLLRTKLEQVAHATAELLARPQILRRIHVGYEDWTRDFDLLDTVGFSSAVPGAIHYDVLRARDPMHDLLGRLFTEKELFRLVDGGITDNVPARAAWRYVQSGRLGARNALVLALDGFAPRLSTPVWLPLQQIADGNVRSSGRYAHVIRRFTRTLSPIDLVPSVENVMRAVKRGRSELAAEMPLLARLLEPLPPAAQLSAP
ncbi:patatin-like phospholipase family protein [Vulgatibacter sp.]|uniref:patatin-like phospholipase family protein n=1 Tax=Vulgatibacter sp. TaxID=1971226 RepID=UPI003568DA59